MSTTLRKAIAFGEAGSAPLNYGYGNNEQYLAWNWQPPGYPVNYANINLLADSQTRWIRLWFLPTLLWPDANGLNTAAFNALTLQMAVAHAYGLGVILTVHHELPSWVTQLPNGATQLDGSPLNTLRAVPSDVGPSSAWYFMFAVLAAIWSPLNPSPTYANGYADVIEFTNEPNLLMQPWKTPVPGPVSASIPTAVGDMFRGAKKIIYDYGAVVPGFYSPAIAGPATSDVGPIAAPHIGYNDFVNAVLDRLDNNGFYSFGADSAVIWTHHNYTDSSCDSGGDTWAPDKDTYYPTNMIYGRRYIRAEKVVLSLFGRWRGWPSGDVDNPKIFITEGGVEHAKLDAVWNNGVYPSEPVYQAQQEVLLSRNLARMADDQRGFGVELMANETLVTSSPTGNNLNFNCGLICHQDSPTPMIPRIVYRDVWQPFPGRL
jgi:hypothetical protein